MPDGLTLRFQGKILPGPSESLSHLSPGRFEERAAGSSKPIVQKTDRQKKTSKPQRGAEVYETQIGNLSSITAVDDGVRREQQ